MAVMVLALKLTLTSYCHYYSMYIILLVKDYSKHAKVDTALS